MPDAADAVRRRRRRRRLAAAADGVRRRSRLRRRCRRRSPCPAATEQAELELGPGRAARAVDAAAGAATSPHRRRRPSTRPRSRPAGARCSESLSSHGVETRLVGMTVGPTVTRYELELGAGRQGRPGHQPQPRHRLRDGRHRRAHPGARSPAARRSASRCPTTPASSSASATSWRSPEAQAATHPLDVAIGKDIAGRAVFLNLATTPHLLIAGATGAGKSSGINCIITSLLMRTTPDQVRLILIDPKQVEMGQYNRLPHLLTQPVTNPKKAANALGWAVQGDGAPLRPAVRGRLPRHRRLQRGVRPRRAAAGEPESDATPDVSSGCRTSSSSSTSSTT